MLKQKEIQRQLMLVKQKRLKQKRETKRERMRERKRLDEKRKRKRQQNEIQQILDRHLNEKLQKIYQEAKKMDAEQQQIVAREAVLQKEKIELQAKLKSQEKKVDYLVRAKRLEEIPLLQKNMEEKQIQDQKFWEQQEAERISHAVEDYHLAVANRERLNRMKPDKEAFLAKLKSERNIVYEDKLREYEKFVKEERKKRLAERQIPRKEEQTEKKY